MHESGACMMYLCRASRASQCHRHMQIYLSLTCVVQVQALKVMALLMAQLNVMDLVMDLLMVMSQGHRMVALAVT